MTRSLQEFLCDLAYFLSLTNETEQMRFTSHKRFFRENVLRLMIQRNWPPKQKAESC